MNVDWQSLFSTGIGAILALVLVKHYIAQLVAKVESMPEKLNDIKLQLSRVTVKLEKLDEMYLTLRDHDREIIKMQADIGSKLRVSNRKPDGACST